MSDGWSGLYLKAKRADIESTLLRLTQNRGYQLLSYIERVDYPQSFYPNVTRVRRSIDVAFFVPVDTDWIRMIGFELANTVHPRAFFGSELVVALGCDAFDCGFLEDTSWWYVYYQNGKVVDRFDSDPIETITQPLYDQPLDPNDPRLIYYLCNNIINWQYAELPDQVLNQFIGRPELLEPILLPGKIDEVSKLFEISSSQEGIKWLKSISTLPFINEYLAFELLSALSNTLREPDEYIEELLSRGLSAMVLQHPKILYGESDTYS